MKVIRNQTSDLMKSVALVSVTVVFTLLVILFVLCFSFFSFIKDTEVYKKEQYQKMYHFDNFIGSKVIVDKSERKKNFIKQSIVIFDRYNAPFSQNDALQIAEDVFEYQEYYCTDGILAYAFFFVETGFHNEKVGDYGEITMAQFMQSTWSEVAKGKWYQGCERNYSFVIECWFEHIRDLSNEFSGTQEERLRKTFLAYNCGKEAIKRLKSAKDVKIYKATVYIKDGVPVESYDEKIFKWYTIFKNIKL